MTEDMTLEDLKGAIKELSQEDRDLLIHLLGGTTQEERRRLKQELDDVAATVIHLDDILTSIANDCLGGDVPRAFFRLGRLTARCHGYRENAVRAQQEARR